MKHLVLISGGWFVVATTVLLLFTPRRPEFSISQNIARRRSTSIVFSVILALTIAGVAAYFYTWFIPHFNLGLIYSILTAVFLFLLLLLAIFPHIPDESARSARIHNTSAWWASYAAMAMLLDILLESYSQVGLLNKILISSFLVFGLVFRIVFNRPRFRRIRLKLESLWLGWFVIIVVSLAYWN